MLRLLKSLSRTVHEERGQDQEPSNGGDVGRYDGDDDSSGGGGEPSSLTVWRKSLFVGCSGFTVINSNGDLVYRVDNYGSHRRQELVLMDASGKPILTVSRSKKLKMFDNWLVFEGELSSKEQKPICRARKHVNVLWPKVKRLARVYYDEKNMYMIEGSYMDRSCKVLDKSRNVVVEIRRKETVTKGVSFGLEVFDLVINQGFDSGLAMAIILLLDQMFL
ncbi:protein LURP-one-related 17-like [Bidens hawaiensis]|uniref:protein LURP-one-related 17-like n=1 Tax=Bidens hawaiensis TaxID=980011 RepID=UPI004049368D